MAVAVAVAVAVALDVIIDVDGDVDVDVDLVVRRVSCVVCRASRVVFRVQLAKPVEINCGSWEKGPKR